MGKVSETYFNAIKGVLFSTLADQDVQSQLIEEVMQVLIKVEPSVVTERVEKSPEIHHQQQTVKPRTSFRPISIRMSPMWMAPEADLGYDRWVNFETVDMTPK